ncbi:MAG: thioredoxin [Verrucomicrobia bacterium]|nr:thioredoxin [Verrucomicrobiota bacterium]MBU4246950.1 thioredoxin [Verrucomicrobiota bacterium]MBU4291342.1 thioredoxin [Verrucomicrobiota bacterium]MBU4498081.1 thioredoxin [Verrucomicrobiota bacterium]MCG2680044.1 thioredoxin [Kiritimatiellia bacterium]
MAEGNVVHFSKDTWQAEVMQAEIPVLVDFWAEWCGPCKMIAPVLNELAAELTGKIKIGKVNVDENRELAEKFHIRSIPTLLVIKGGAVQEQMVGALRKADLKAKLNTYL